MLCSFFFFFFTYYLCMKGLILNALTLVRPQSNQILISPWINFIFIYYAVVENNIRRTVGYKSD